MAGVSTAVCDLSQVELVPLVVVDLEEPKKCAETEAFVHVSLVVVDQVQLKKWAETEAFEFVLKSGGILVGAEMVA